MNKIIQNTSEKIKKIFSRKPSARPYIANSHVYNVFSNVSHPKSRWEWVRLSLIILVIIYFIGLVTVMTIAFRPDRSPEKKKDFTKITSRDKFLDVAVRFYPLPASVVNNEIITLRQFYKQLSYIKHYNARVPNSISKEITDEAALYRRVNESLIETHILRQQAQKYHISVSNADIDNAYKQVTDPNGGSKQVAKVLRDLYDMSPSEFRGLIRDQLLKEKIIKELLVQVHVRHILTTDAQRANDALARINKGEKFEDVAKAVSEDANTNKNGGDLGWLSRQDIRTKIDPIFEQAVFKLNIGQVSPVIKTKYGFHIIKLEEKRGRIDKTYDDWFNEVKSKAHIIRFIRY